MICLVLFNIESVKKKETGGNAKNGQTFKKKKI
jgi:hypothetical protein